MLELVVATLFAIPDAPMGAQAMPRALAQQPPQSEASRGQAADDKSGQGKSGNGKARVPEPKGAPGSWITAADYPASARREGRGGVVGFRLEIDKSGMVTACDVILSSGHRDLDNATCAVMAMRGSFVPARNARGAPALGAYFGRVDWQPLGTAATP